jgi:hypothetical protein
MPLAYALEAAPKHRKVLGDPGCAGLEHSSRSSLKSSLEAPRDHR